MHKTIKIPASHYENHDDCLAAAAEDYSGEHPEASGYDLNPRWHGGDDADREFILLDVPAVEGEA